MKTQVISNQKISALLRSGSKGLPQNTRAYFRFEDQKIKSCCAIGAMYIGMFGIDVATTKYVQFKAKESDIDLGDELKDIFPALKKPTPLTDMSISGMSLFKKERTSLISSIAQLNDDGYTLMQIADQLEEAGL
jgi:hypothetical protein